MVLRGLEDLGLTQGETKVYMALLGLGESTTGPIVSESGISASKVYGILDKLSKKGLVSHISKGNAKYFKAASPQRLLNIIEEKEERIKTEKLLVKELIPKLELKQQTAVTEETAEVYEGLKGIQTARERTLRIMKKGDVMWIIGIARTPYDRLTQYFKDYHKRRIKKGIKCRYIYNEYAKDPFGIRSSKYKLSEVRYMPKGMTTHAWMEIYADTVTIGINYIKSFSVVIQNQAVADSYRNYAELLWRISKK